MIQFGAYAQIENVLLERYHEASSSEGGKNPLVTYRIYIDLEEGHILQSVYGDTHHMLTIGTSTAFYNDTLHGVVFGERIDPMKLSSGPGALDSWFAFGFCSAQHKAVPLHLDPDGSILPCPPRKCMKKKSGEPTPSTHFCERDGMVTAERVPETVKVDLTTGYLDQARGGLVESNNCAWGVLGGVKGATQENMVLIAQLTTDGELHYALNLQVRTPQGGIIRCTAMPTENTEERYFPVLKSTVAQ